MNENAMKGALKFHPVDDIADLDSIRSLVVAYESSITGKQDHLGNDKAIELSIKNHPVFCKESGAGWRCIYNFLSEYEDRKIDN